MEILRSNIAISLPRRVIVTWPILQEIVSLAEAAHKENLESVDEDEKNFLRRRKPEIQIRLIDGSTYTETLLDKLRDVNLSKDRMIRSISVKTIYGGLSISVDLEAGYQFYSPRIICSGPDDRARYLCEKIKNLLLQEKDISFYVRKSNVLINAIIITILIFLLIGFISQFMNIGISYKILAYPIVFSLLMFPIMSLAEFFREKMFAPVGFMWNSNLERENKKLKIARNVLVAIPVWVLGGVLGSYMF